MFRKHRTAPFVALAALVAYPAAARATPSTNFWAPSTHAIQGYGVLHPTYDTYFGTGALYPVDLGLTMGVLPSKNFQAEVGFDLFYPTGSPDGPLDAPLLLNAKCGQPEGAWFEGSPGWSAGIYNLGFEDDVTDYNILYATVGRTFPKLGTVSVGGYHGLNEDLFRDPDGGEARSGVLAGWFSPPMDVPYIDRIHFTWDLQTGSNAYGATGGGAAFYLTPATSLLMGPVFFLERDLQPGRSAWMWSVQFDADVPLLGAP